MSECEKNAVSTTVSSVSTATVTCSGASPVTNSRAVASTGLQMESEALTINQQLANQLAGRPVAKRKRGGSFDQRSSSLSISPKVQQQMSLEIKKIGFIGAGNMARAIAEGWINSGQVKPSNIIATVKSIYSENLKLMKALGVSVSLLNRDVIGQCDIIVLAVKPYQVLDIMQEIHQTYKTAANSTGGHGHALRTLRPLIVSVAAAVPLSEIEKKAEISWQIGGSPIVGHLPIIRCLPNIGCAVQSGVTVYTRGRFCNEEDTKPFVTLFSALGHCEEVEEKYIDPFVSLTGSGLAFMGVALEAMADGGVMAGIPFQMSLRMSAQTMIGAANLILRKNLHPGQVKNAAASPGGTTISGILSLESGGLRASMINAVKVAADRAAELKSSTVQKS